MSKDSSDNSDELIRKKNFGRATGIDLSAFNLNQDVIENKEPESKQEIQEPEMDQAVGEVYEFFTEGKQVTEDNVEQFDSVTDFAVQGESRVSGGLLVMMILTYSIFATLIGTVVPQFIAAPTLVALIVSGLYLGERWIPNPNMRLLGVTWVIISMKIFYGLAIDAHHWGWLDGFGVDEDIVLGISLLAIVAVNVFIAQRHNEDAIAAQATLVLLAVGSAAGAIYGEMGVAVMICLGVILFHVLAFLRNSGNLASLGIATSYLWVGLHAISQNWKIAGIDFVPFEDDLLLFILMFFVTGVNATVATRFSSERNWFSDGFEALGLGKPGLWSVSVGLGMIGAFLALTAFRDQTGYALAQLSLLGSAFSASYLVVRGVSWNKVIAFVGYPAPILLAILILMTGRDTELFGVLSGYDVYSVLTVVLTGFILLQNQTNVSDQVIWGVGVSAVLILTILIPAEDYSGARMLLYSQAVVWIGMGALALLRRSAGIAGFSVLGPWIWLLMVASGAEDRIISVEILPTNFPEYDMTAVIILMLVQQYTVNAKLGSTNLNLAAAVPGLSEFGARLRDSNFMNLWNIGFIVALISISAITQPGKVPAVGLIVSLNLLVVAHAAMAYFQIHRGNPRTLLGIWGAFTIVISWVFGYSPFWTLGLFIAVLLLLLDSDRLLRTDIAKLDLEAKEAMPAKLLTMSMGLVAGYLIVLILEPPKQIYLTGYDLISDRALEAQYLGFISVGMLLLYLRRAAKLEKLLPPTISAVGMIICIALAGGVYDSQELQTLAAVVFVGSGLWLISQGEIRSSMRSLATINERLQRHQLMSEVNYMESTVDVSQDSNQPPKSQPVPETVLNASQIQTEEVFAAPSEPPGDSEVSTPSIQAFDVRSIELLEKQKKRAKRRSVESEYDLIVGDISYNPTIVILFLAVLQLFGILVAYSGTSTTFIPILVVGTISVMLIFVAKQRAKSFSLRLPDLLGLEAPIAASMIGLSVILLAGRIGLSPVYLDDQLDSMFLLVCLSGLAAINLIGFSDKNLRLLSSLEGVVGLYAFVRIIGLFAGGEMPIPFRINPFENPISWSVPMLTTEIFLIGAAVLFWSIESKHFAEGREDVRGAGGRIGWFALIFILSSGIASLIALVCVLNTGIKWKQPAVVLSTFVCVPASVSQLLFWLEEYIQFIEPLDRWHVSIAFGAISMMSLVYVIKEKLSLWLSTSIWATHLLLAFASFTGFGYSGVVVAMLVLSACAWIPGVLTMRRGWRLFGMVDLVIAWTVMASELMNGASSIQALVMLTATIVLLSVITYLTQSREQDIMESS